MLQVIATRCAPGYRGHCVFFFKQKSAYEMRISDWSSDVCSSDLLLGRRTAALIAVSESEADLVRGLRLVDPRRLHVVPNGIELEPPDRLQPSLRARLGIDAATPLVGTVARLVPQKAPELFVQACAAVAAARPDARFVLVGAGPR